MFEHRDSTGRGTEGTIDMSEIQMIEISLWALDEMSVEGQLKEARVYLDAALRIIRNLNPVPDDMRELDLAIGKVLTPQAYPNWNSSK